MTREDYIDEFIRHCSDLIPYNTPNYDEVLLERANKYADEMLNPDSELKKLCEWHDSLIDNHSSDVEEPDKSLEEAITSFFDNFPGLEKINWDWRCDTLTMASDAIRTFAKHFFELGKKDMKEQMLKEAAEAKTFYLPFGKWRVTALVGKDKIEEDDKVRIVVLKEGEID